MKIAICDDEQNFLDNLKQLIKEYSLFNDEDIEVKLFKRYFDLSGSIER